jgi:riboflavin kinase/FMN adenylyltransferase
MSVEQELTNLSPTRDTLLTVGVFDGVHLGHKHLLASLVQNAKKENLISGVITFRQHPQTLLHPQPDIRMLTSLHRRIQLLKEEGAELVISLNFSLELAQMGIQNFVGLLQSQLKMRGLVVGPDFAMGRNREGDIETLRGLQEKQGFSLTVVPPGSIEGKVISSTAIRQALAGGDIQTANAMLGRCFQLEGSVVSGSGRGRDLGFPTANMDIDPIQALPQDGVYATLAYLDGKSMPSVTSIGGRPTFGETERSVEVHILDYSGELYTRQLKVDIIERLRGQQRFDSADGLTAQVNKDIQKAREILDSPDSE